MGLANLAAAERKVYSQNGEDGVIEAIFAAFGVTNRYFVEFGVEDATECNTAYLLEQGWTGLLMDGAGISRNPRATVRRETVSPENVNDLFAKYGVPREFDLLCIDIDGNDYWVWQALAYRPRVVVIEYNAMVPAEPRRVIPYDPKFRWSGSDYFGASLGALAELGRRKSYELVHCERTGSNAFFVARSELPAGYAARPTAEIYRPPSSAHQYFPPDPYRILLDPDCRGLLEQARRAHQTGAAVQAERLYREFLQSAPCHAEALHLLGYLEHQSGRNEEAVASIARAIALDPSVAIYHATLGDALRDQGKLTEACVSYRRGLQVDPDQVEALKHLALALKDQGLMAEAAECLRRVVRLYPTDVDAYNNLGNVLRNLGHVTEAIKCYRMALRLIPEHANAHNNLGIALALQGDAEAAVASFRRAVSVNPQFVDALSNLGVALQQQGQLDEAVACYREAVRQDPHHANARRNLGRALRALGRPDEAANT